MPACATGLVKVTVNVPEPLVIDIPDDPTPSSNVPELLYTTAFLAEELKRVSAVEVELSYAFIVKSFP